MAPDVTTDDSAGDTESRVAAAALSRVTLDRYVARHQQWQQSAAGYPPAWQAVGGFSQSIWWVTPGEAEELEKELRELFFRFRRAVRRLRRALIPARLPVTIPALVLAGQALTWIGIGAATLIQRSTPTDVLGRVDSVMELAVSAPQTMFIAVGAGLVAVIDCRLLLGVVLAAMTTSGTWLGHPPRTAKPTPQRPPPDRSASRGTHRQLIAELTARYPPPGVAPVRAGGRTARSAIGLRDVDVTQCDTLCR